MMRVMIIIVGAGHPKAHTEWVSPHVTSVICAIIIVVSTVHPEPRAGRQWCPTPLIMGIVVVITITTGGPIARQARDSLASLLTSVKIIAVVSSHPKSLRGTGSALVIRAVAEAVVVGCPKRSGVGMAPHRGREASSYHRLPNCLAVRGWPPHGRDVSKGHHCRQVGSKPKQGGSSPASQLITRAMVAAVVDSRSKVEEARGRRSVAVPQSSSQMPQDTDTQQAGHVSVENCKGR
ncbi:hypothetical protein BJV78DRAFT_213276 [Lactifluus subvellereus]|nr:hypothetical protein BJV78DRAFT_213276 [Lactifluus subvellereus]